jgi:hypothetical protein
LNVAQAIARRFEQAHLTEPNPLGTFGKMAFSHSIIHQIGGGADTNENTTQRVLLLLESKAIGNDEAYKRVTSNVLNRYLDDDISFLTSGGNEYKVPRFLLNDIVRYWRTMCVDYASKHRERQGQGWALRNAKLRLSRKLIFVSGLLACFSCRLQRIRGEGLLFDQPETLRPLLSHLMGYVSRTPLEILAGGLKEYGKPTTAVSVIDAYEAFLALVDDGEKRDNLKKLASMHARSDPTFNEVRKVSQEFQNGLTSFFFDEHDELAKLTREYGVF